MIDHLLDGFAGQFDVGIVGAGHVADAYHLPILSNISSAAPAYIADVDGDRARRLADRYGTEAVTIDDQASLPACDAILLAIPVGFRPPYIHEFGDRGIPIFTEKPFAMDAEMHAEFCESADTLLCNYMRTLYGTVKQLDDVISSELLGPLQRVELRAESVGPTGKGTGHYQTDPEVGGGLLLEKGVHSLSQLQFLLRDWNWTVVSSDIVWEKGIDVDIDSQLRLRNGSREIDVSYRLSGVKPVGSTARFHFEHGTLSLEHVDPSQGLSLSLLDDSMPTFDLETADGWPTSNHQAMYLRWKQFLRLAAGESLDQPALTTGAGVTEIVDEMYAQGEK
jgi:predicted dehydrogenase